MMLLTEELGAKLRANAAATRDAQRHGNPEPGPAPVVKFFNPVGAATWLATEIDADGDTLFGLADLGFGCPELGSFSLAEIASVRLAFGLGIERDLGFASAVPLSVWADTARTWGSIGAAETRLSMVEPTQRAARDTPFAPDPEIPAPPTTSILDGPISDGPRSKGRAG